MLWVVVLVASHAAMYIAGIFSHKWASAEAKAVVDAVNKATGK